MIFSVLFTACPLLLCSLGALFSEYAGVLALFLDGLVTFSAFLTYYFTVLTHSVVAGACISCLISMAVIFCFSMIMEFTDANRFIAAMAMNLLFSALPSFLSFAAFGTRGVLVSSDFVFQIVPVKILSICVSFVLIAGGVIFLSLSRPGLYLRITGSDSDVLRAKGVNPKVYRVMSWMVAALYANVAGTILATRISSFVPNICSGRGWMALAAVFLGKKKPLRIVIAVLIFCAADVFSANIQNFFQGVPNSILLSFPYLVALIFIMF